MFSSSDSGIKMAAVSLDISVLSLFPYSPTDNFPTGKAIMNSFQVSVPLLHSLILWENQRIFS